MPNGKLWRPMSSFGHLSFVILSTFVIRISSLSIASLRRLLRSNRLYARCRFRRLESLDRLDAEMFLRAIQFELHLLAHVAVEQGLGNGAEVADDTPFRVRIPSAENGEAFDVLRVQFGHLHSRADVDHVRL